MIRPLGDRVVIKVSEGDMKTASGIVLPDTAKEKPQEGEVVAVGTGKMLDNGTRAQMEVKTGDKVIFSKYSGSEVKVDEQNYLIVRESDILAVL
ncbi:MULTISPECIES: co-chaperone GroES [Selenomonas]|jgi:chaperonin 10 Kd subunit|uniref:Co-chaperonin GroES n=1 Tax=Selenomonas sputigena (strain ATCC 35185 / DSM 20758 / CCUG 44933 / VPI D19B-28) TaxID=546271 RepID=C9LWG7_SELS3|nr:MULTISPECIES: co-chaperone GroES [Selenomonas]AEB99672.1 Chaperonin Cpn10 [Selenomonas sputigena ATCC 35185]EEX76817.1 chaperonin GroS [Selenomonas sputigena ATCC 35185]EJU25491.1 chaperonin GroS [Selenomonas sp. CM52]UZD43265.1 co-chaperone GroES [Selenomonas sputigena]UZE44367.1 co-chaperone GroES [Selenomonas sputigena]